MCGIAGVISEAVLGEGDRALLASVNGALRHRGPDDEGFLFDGEVGLAMRRLSIVDLAGGHQPLFNEDRSLALVCNGEIYNHAGLRRDLEARGHRPATRSDVETILHLYEERDLGCVDPLRGMYAFALWDGVRRRLVLGRDRLGEKPLYLWRGRRTPGGPRQLWFASELRALLQVVPAPERRLDAAALGDYLTFAYVLEPQTPVAGIVQLPPGHLLVADPRDLDAEPRRYWDFAAIEPARSARPADAVRGWLEEACRRMGSADVPVGVALSGGIDSSLVAALAARAYPGQIRAFSVGYVGRPATDERAIARRFAEGLGIPFSEIEIDRDAMAGGFADLVRDMDTPVADIAAFGYSAVAAAARREGVPVLLSGLGGDEMFWGYQWVRDAVSRAERPPARAPWWRALLGPRQAAGETSLFAAIADFAADEALARGFLAEGAAGPPGRWLEATRPASGPAPAIALSDVLNRTWLLGNCLALLDRVSMARSVELRLPFLDIDLVEGVTGLRRGGLDDHRRSHKALLLEAVGDLLPDEIVHRPKQGFTPPVQDWIRAVLARREPGWLRDGPLASSGLVDPHALATAEPRLSPMMRYKLAVLDSWVGGVFLQARRPVEDALPPQAA